MATNTLAKRTNKQRSPRVRGEPVVKSILAITLDELARTGFAALRVEDVAERAGVNKTTVYRRWPTRAALVRAALLFATEDDISIPDTGSLEKDLVLIGHQMVELAAQPRWQSMIRMILSEGADSELRAIAQSIRESYEPLRRSLARAAVARGEVKSTKEGLMLLELFDAAMHVRLFVSQVGVDAKYIAELASFLVSRGKSPVRRSPKRG